MRKYVKIEAYINPNYLQGRKNAIFVLYFCGLIENYRFDTFALTISFLSILLYENLTLVFLQTFIKNKIKIFDMRLESLVRKDSILKPYFSYLK